MCIIDSQIAILTELKFLVSGTQATSLLDEEQLLQLCPAAFNVTALA